jgi:S-DNA-T family DNA segregation ATPase FtsK/SpoIIIE
MDLSFTMSFIFYSVLYLIFEIFLKNFFVPYRAFCPLYMGHATKVKRKKTKIVFNYILSVMVKKKDSVEESFNPLKQTTHETRQGVFAVISFVLAIFFILAALHKSGVAGEKIYSALLWLFGIGYFLVPLFFILLTISFLKNIKKKFTLAKSISAFIAFLSSLGLVDLLIRNQGGKLGHIVSAPLISLFAIYASFIILVGLLFASLLLLFDAELDMKFFSFRKDTGKESDEENKKKNKKGKKEFEEVEVNIPEDLTLAEENSKDGAQSEKENTGKKNKGNIIPTTKDDTKEEFMIATKKGPPRNENYVPLPLSLLEGDKGKPGVGDIKANANIIKRTLQNFGIDVEMDEISIGPSVTRYALKPAEGVKLSRIVALQNDLALALAAHPIRIEAPIPGKSLVGIEIPNSTKTTVGLATLLASPDYQTSEKPLLISLGKGISGKSHFSNLAKMPHLLIAGATGSGKSVTIHSIITSLLYRNHPQNLKFIMIDPKRVELTLYNKIPHLLTPVITEAKKAILSLKWAAKEMDRRYDILEAESVRDIESYHKNVVGSDRTKPRIKEDGSEQTQEIETMPYIVIVIDELADIMQTYPRELESAIVRLAQMSRAVGIHLMLSTQRPSVNVITGLIKANIPARLALQVASQIDSRTILDTSGAEKLLGAGDMLFLSGEMSKPQRIQSSYISETELKKVVKFLSENYETEIPSDITMTAEKDKNSLFEANLDDSDLEDDDELYEEARQIIVEAGKASTSYIQRKLRVGYARAARLMDLLEERGVIGAADGSKPRSVIGQENEENDIPEDSDALPSSQIAQ